MADGTSGRFSTQVLHTYKRFDIEVLQVQGRARVSAACMQEHGVKTYSWRSIKSKRLHSQWKATDSAWDTGLCFRCPCLLKSKGRTRLYWRVQ